MRIIDFEDDRQKELFLLRSIMTRDAQRPERCNTASTDVVDAVDASPLPSSPSLSSLSSS
jgi:hypothetical protein